MSNIKNDGVLKQLDIQLVNTSNLKCDTKGLNSYVSNSDRPNVLDIIREENRIKNCKHDFVIRACFGQPGSIQECVRCGKIKPVSLFC